MVEWHGYVVEGGGDGEKVWQGDGVAGRCGGTRGAIYGRENAGIGSGDGHGSGDAVEGGGRGAVTHSRY